LLALPGPSALYGNKVGVVEAEARWPQYARRHNDFRPRCSTRHKEERMAKLSEQLADLSVHAKNAEDAVAAAQKEAHDEIVARMEQARNAATSAIEKVNQDLESAGDTAARGFSAVKAKIDADISALKANVAQAKHNLDAKRAENHADRLEWEAGVAIDYAIASVEQARLATLDAVVARVEAAEAKSA
jgi:hypothetical protein